MRTPRQTRRKVFLPAPGDDLELHGKISVARQRKLLGRQEGEFVETIMVTMVLMTD